MKRLSNALLSAGLILVLDGLTVPGFSDANAQTRPNVLMIAIDDQNDWIGCLGGHPQAQTPHIDQLAARGTLFANAHCQSPLCNSSRTSVLLGLRPSTTGIYGLGPWFRDVPELKDLVSLPQCFAANGYRTSMAGKVYHGDFGRTPGLEFDVVGPPVNPGPMPAKKLVDTPSKNRWVDWGLFPHQDEDKGDYKIATWAKEQLADAPDEPFFMAIGFFLPHVPCYATERWFDLYPIESLQLPHVLTNDRDDTPRFSWYMHWKLPEPRLAWVEQNSQWENLVRSYLACTSFTDHQVGRVLASLEEQGLADNTIVVLWSDHGWHLGEKLITGKNSLWDPSTRVPLIFAGPGVASGQTVRQPAELLDIYPTLVELCGLSEPPSLEGIALNPQLVDHEAPRSRPAITTHNPGNHGVRSDRWRYIVYADGAEELYDTEADPEEFRNLAEEPQYADVKQQLRKSLPEKSAPHAPGSHSRILTYHDGQATWEGEVIPPNAPPP